MLSTPGLPLLEILDPLWSNLCCAIKENGVFTLVSCTFASFSDYNFHIMLGKILLKPPLLELHLPFSRACFEAARRFDHLNGRIKRIVLLDIESVDLILLLVPFLVIFGSSGWPGRSAR